ncbi:MAG: VOC family protein [Aggregatilineales bacterium]
MKLGIVILYVHDIEKATAFYRDVVGFTIEPGANTSAFVFLRPADSPSFALQDISTTTADKAAKGGCTEIGFLVDDVDATFKRWKAKGVEIVTEPEDKPFGRYFLAKDPEGHFLDVFGKAGG